MAVSLGQISKELFAQKTRLFLTILAITWGTLSIAMMLSIGQGLRVTFAKAVANTGQNLLIVQQGKTAKLFRGSHKNKAVSFNKQYLKTVSTLPAVRYVSPQYSWEVKVTYDTKTNYQPILAVSADYNKIHSIDIQVPGRFISPIDEQQYSRVVVLGNKVLTNLKLKITDPVGKTIFMSGIPFKIIGIMQEKSQISAGRTTPDANTIWMPSATYEMIKNPTSIPSIALMYKDNANLEALENQIQRTIAFNHSLDPDDDSIVEFKESAKQQNTIDTFFFGMQIFLGIIGSLTLAVAGIGIANVMYASVKRSTRIIGIRMAIGAKTYHIVMHYVLEAVIATAIGGVFGLLLSGGLIYIINFIPMKGPLFDTIGKPHPILSWSVIASVVIILGLVGFLAGLFPALKASRIDPSEALSYE